MLRRAMHERDSCYRLSGLIEVDDALIGGTACGQARQVSPPCPCFWQRGHAAGYLAARVLPDGVKQAAVHHFASQRFTKTDELRSDALPALASLGERHTHKGRVTPPAPESKWLPKVHIIIANLKRSILGTFHGISKKYLQESIDEFTYRFNRRRWEGQLPQRLLETTVSHVPVSIRAV